MTGEGGRHPGFGKLISWFWKIPARVRGPPRDLENSTQGFGKVCGHNSDLTIDIHNSKKREKFDPVR